MVHTRAGYKVILFFIHLAVKRLEGMRTSRWSGTRGEKRGGGAKDPVWCWVLTWRYGRSKSAVSGGLWNTYSDPRRVLEVWLS